MATLLVVDLLAERDAFGRMGVEEIVKHFPDHKILLWAPHVEIPLDYSFGTRVDEPDEYDVVVITGSRRNVSMWEPWMDRVAKLIKECEVPLYGICFGHQIICKVLGGEVIRAKEKTERMLSVNYNDGRVVNQLKCMSHVKIPIRLLSGKSGKVRKIKKVISLIATKMELLKC